MRRVRADEAWDGWPELSGWEPELPGLERPTPQQIADSMARVHKARRELLPPADDFVNAPIRSEQLLAWVARWSKMRTA
jgi:hypothetical protein